jgi:branched-subunit amino acid transport protein
MSWLVLGVVAGLCFTLRVAAPFALRSRPLPPAVGQRLEAVVAPMLAGLVAIQLLGAGGRWSVDPRAAGVAVAGLVYWRGRRLPVALVVAAAVTALLRMIM